MDISKKQVYDFWNDNSCGEELFLKSIDKEAFSNQLKIRYELEPYILEFAEFQIAMGKKVLEIGIGLGADHQMFAESGAKLWGIDLTERAVSNTKKRFEFLGLKSNLSVSDAENLKYENNYFDLVYSWGVLHHTPNTQKAVDEVWRVLKPGCIAKVMIYHKYSIVGLMLWVRYALILFRPWRSLSFVYRNFMESPGTKAYTVKESEILFSKFTTIKTKIVLTHSDLLESESGQRHRGLLLKVAKKLWPRKLIRSLFSGRGLFLMVEGVK